MKTNRILFIISIFFLLSSCMSKNPFYGVDGEDKTAPSINVTYPTPNTAQIFGGTFTLLGTSADSGGDNSVLKVEISTDGGTTWNLAGGTTDWSYTVPTMFIWGAVNQTITIMIRATDTDYKKNQNTISVTYVIDNTSPSLLGSVSDVADVEDYDESSGAIVAAKDGYHNATEGTDIIYEWAYDSTVAGYQVVLRNLTDGKVDTFVKNISGMIAYTTYSGTEINPGGSEGTITTGVISPQIENDGIVLHFKFTGVEDKRYMIEVQAYDSNKQGSDTKYSVEEQIDTTAPVVGAVNFQVNGLSTNNTNHYVSALTFNWTEAGVTEAGSGVAQYKIYITGTATQTILMPVGSTEKTITVANGTYNAEIKVVDKAGNESSTSVTLSNIVVAAETTAPTDPSFSAPTANTVVNVNTGVVFTLNAGADTGGSGFSHFKYVVVTDGVAGAETTTAGTTIDLSGSAVDGSTYKIQIVAVDNAGNESGLVNSSSITYKTTSATAPANLKVDGVATGTTVYSQTGNVMITWDSVTDAASYEISTDGATANIATGVTSTSYNSTADFTTGNTYNIYVRARYNATDTTNWATAVVLTVDSTAPTDPSFSAPTADTVVTVNTGVVFTLNAGADADSGFSHFKYVVVIDGVAGAETTTTGTTIDFSGTAVDGSTYKIQVAAVDNAGKESALINSSIITYKTTSATAPANLKVGGVATGTTVYSQTGAVLISWDAVTGAVSYEISSDGATADIATGITSTYYNSTTDFTTEGTYNIYVRARYNATDTSNWATAVTLVVDGTAPNAPTIGGFVNDGWSQGTVSWTAVTDLPGGLATDIDYYEIRVTYGGEIAVIKATVDSGTGNITAITITEDLATILTSIDTVPPVATPAFAIQFTVANANNIHYVRIRAIDRAGNATAWSASSNVTITNP